jgi:hypothetical protein
LSKSLSSAARAHARAEIGGALLAAAVLATATIAAPAPARPYTAAHGKVFVGVTGGRTAGGYARASGKRPAVFQFFVAWGDPFRYAYRRAREAGAGLMVHLSTYNGPGTRERIAPRDIALGRGDRYLLALRRDFAAYRRPVYLRLFGEMNNAANPYSAFNHDGSARDSAHARWWFRRAWRRVYLVVKGGRVATVDARLRALGMPRLGHLPMRRHAGFAELASGNGAARLRPAAVRWLPRPKVAVQWTPMTAGSPDIAANGPDSYWPGGAYVDWVGTDFYSSFPNFPGLDRFYAIPRYAAKPFVFGEWAMWGHDDPSFMQRFFAWVAAHPRVRMLAYNQGNHPTSPFRLYRYPKAAREMRAALQSRRYAGRSGRTLETSFRRAPERPLTVPAARPARWSSWLSAAIRGLWRLTTPRTTDVPAGRASTRPMARTDARRAPLRWEFPGPISRRAAGHGACARGPERRPYGPSQAALVPALSLGGGSPCVVPFCPCLSSPRCAPCPPRRATRATPAGRRSTGI